MNFNQYIISLKAANPKLFEASKITISPESFTAQLKLAFEMGEKSKIDSRSSGEDLFGKIFGQKL